MADQRCRTLLGQAQVLKHLQSGTAATGAGGGGGGRGVQLKDNIEGVLFFMLLGARAQRGVHVHFGALAGKMQNPGQLYSFPVEPGLFLWGRIFAPWLAACAVFFGACLALIVLSDFIL